MISRGALPTWLQCLLLPINDFKIKTMLSMLFYGSKDESFRLLVFKADTRLLGFLKSESPPLVKNIPLMR